MKKIIPFFCFLLFALLYDLDAAEVNLPKSEIVPSRLYLGGEMTHLKINTKIIGQQIKGKNTFKGLRFGYDIIKPNTPYFGFHGVFMYDKAAFQFNPIPEKSHFVFQPKIYKGKSFFINPECRIGQTFIGQEALSTLFFGIGSYFSRIPYGNLSSGKKSFYFSELLGYLTAGALISYSLSPTLQIGCSLKTLRIFYSRETMSWDSQYKDCTSQETRKNKDSSWGYEFGVPLTWHSTKIPSFDLQLEPYYLKLKTKRGKIKGYGVRFTLGSRF